MASGNMGCTSAIHLWKEMHLEQFMCSLSSLPTFLASRNHHVLGAEFLLPSGLFPHPFHPIYSPELTFNKAVQSDPLIKRTLLPHPLCFAGVCVSLATLFMSGSS